MPGLKLSRPHRPRGQQVAPHVPARRRGLAVVRAAAVSSARRIAGTVSAGRSATETNPPALGAAETGWPGRSVAGTVSPASGVTAMLGPRALWRDHRLFTILVTLSLVPRVLAALAFRPALLTSDSFLYMQEATRGALGQIRPSGYSWFLDLLRPLPDRLLAVTTAQHLMGIAIAGIVYGLLRYWGLPAWGASLAAAPTLVDTREIALESYVLPDTLYAVVLLLAVALLLTRRTPGGWQCALAGLLAAYVSLLRGNGLALAAIFAAFLLIRRVGWRAITAAGAAFAAPVAGYLLAFHASYGQYNLTDSDGIFLWSRTTSFANCAIIKPAAALAPLCPDRSRQVSPAGPAPAWSVGALTGAPTPADYLWAPGAWWRHDRHPGINAYNNGLGLRFALRAIEAQPLGYLRAAGRDVMLLFLNSDRPVSHAAMSFTGTPHIPRLPSYFAQDEFEYAGTRGNTHAVQPYAYLLFLYQMPVYFPGLVFFGVVIAGLAGVLRRWRRGGGMQALPWALAAASIVVPALLTQSLYRYSIVAIPLACLAAGLAFAQTVPLPGRAAPLAGTALAGTTPADAPLAGTARSGTTPAAPAPSGTTPAAPAPAGTAPAGTAPLGATPDGPPGAVGDPAGASRP